MSHYNMRCGSNAITAQRVNGLANQSMGLVPQNAPSLEPALKCYNCDEHILIKSQLPDDILELIIQATNPLWVKCRRHALDEFIIAHHQPPRKNVPVISVQPSSSTLKVVKELMQKNIIVKKRNKVIVMFNNYKLISDYINDRDIISLASFTGCCILKYTYLLKIGNTNPLGGAVYSHCNISCPGGCHVDSRCVISSASSMIRYSKSSVEYSKSSNDVEYREYGYRWKDYQRRIYGDYDPLY